MYVCIYVVSWQWHRPVTWPSLFALSDSSPRLIGDVAPIYVLEHGCAAQML